MITHTALISIRPEHVAKILSGEKRVEFRRSWGAKPVSRLVIYSTAPEQRIVAIADIKEVFRGSPSRLWIYSRPHGPGITRTRLLAYLNGKKAAVAIQIDRVHALTQPVALDAVLPKGSRPPQSFHYLSEMQVAAVETLILIR